MSIETVPNNSISFVPEVQHDERAFNSIVLYTKADKISGLLVKNDPERLGSDVESVANVLRWGVDQLGHQTVNEYLYEITPTEALVAMSLAKNDEQRANWRQHSQYKPSLELRYKQLEDLHNKFQHMSELDWGDELGAPLDLRLVKIPYKKIATEYMPSFWENDKTKGRVTDPSSHLAAIYNGEVHISDELLRLERGKVTYNPQGIEYGATPIGEFAGKSAIMANYGLMLVDRHLYDRRQLRMMRERSGVNCMGAGLAEGLALCEANQLPIGTAIVFPKHIPNSQDDFYCGVDIGRSEYPDTDVPRLYFGELRSQPDKNDDNCLFAITVDTKIFRNQ